MGDRSRGLALSACAALCACDPGGAAAVAPRPMTDPPGIGEPGRPCTAHGQCLSRVCGLRDPLSARYEERVCLATADVVFVRGGGTCPPGGGRGTQEEPACSLEAGLRQLDRGAARSLRLLEGGTLEGLKQDSGLYVIYGDDERTGLRSAEVTRRGRLVLDGVWLLGAEAALRCTGEVTDTTLAFVRGEVRGSQATALHAQGCQVRIHASGFRGGQDGAVHLERSLYRISNSEFTDNRSGLYPAVRLGDDSQALDKEAPAVEGGAVLRNQAGSRFVPGGVDCGDGSDVVLQNVRICGNSPGPSGRQVGSRCITSECSQ